MTASNEHNNAPAVSQGEADGVQREIAAALALFPIDISSQTFRVSGVNSDQPLDADDDTQFFSKKKVMALLEKLYGHLTAAATPAPAPAVPQGWNLVQTPITEEMHVAAAKVLHRAPGLAGLPQRMLDAMLAATPAPAPAQEVATLSLAAEDVHAAFAKNFPKSRISQAWINFAADIAQAIAARAAKPAQEVTLTGCNCRWDGSEQVQWCELHLAHKDAIHEWAERAKTAEAKLDRLSSNQEVGLTEAERVRCLIASGCIGTVKMTYDSGPYEITRTSINASRLIDAIIAALRAKGGK